MDFKAKYNRTDFTVFFRDKLLPEDFQLHTESIVPDFKSNYFKEITFLGKSRSLDLNVYEIRHTSEKDARVGLSRDAFKLVSRFSENNALILFVPDNPANFRLSLVTIDPKLDARGVKVLKEYSNPRRYSFVLGEDAKTHTPEQYLIGQGRIADITDLKKRFSVEVVNKEFYGQIAEMFSKLVGGKRKKGSRTIEYQRTLVLPSVGAADEQKFKEFAVRLIGRTVFCWFLKKKKSDNGIPLIGNDVLSGFEAGFTTNFYHARVEPLFFEVLNTAIDKRKPEYQKEPFRSIPFLNGGLFEPHLDDFYVNGTPNYALKIPDEWWREFLNILETYNFTIDENTSIDIDLSVDPEMLGRIFENLLAEINPETGETARKATGSYYTPRPIVEYMVDQSLKQYLIAKTNIDSAKLDILLDYSNELSGLDESEEKQVLEAINNIKVLDPACGSGAFPMGVLQKMLLILQKVDHGAVTSVQQILNEIADPIKRELIKRKLEAAKVLDDVDFDDYARKLNVIQRSIYGVDIQPIAADISRLRFFLSLIVDEVIQDEQPNRGIEPLPNLEFKFVCANTLIPLPEPDSFEKMFGDTEIVQELEEIRTNYFTASNDDKPALRKQFEDLQKKLYKFLLQNQGALNNPNSRLALLSSWKPFSDEASPWFEPKWMFGVDGGFDIAIGNPPYIVSKGGRYTGMEFSKELINFLKNHYVTAEQQFNTYTLFMELSGNLISKNGVVYFIVPNTFLANEYSFKLRNFLTSDCNIYELFITGLVFESATVETVVIGYGKQKQTLMKVRYNSNEYALLNTKEIISLTDDKKLLIKLNEDTFKLIKKLNQNPTLSKYAKTWRGLTTGDDERFIKDSIKSKHHKPLITGSEISKYGQLVNYKFVEYLPDLLDRARDERIFLLSEKLISKFVGEELIFTYDNEQYYVLNSGCCTEIIDENVKIKYLLALLNSKLLNFYFSNVFSDYRDTFPIMKSGNIESLPILVSSASIQKLFVKKVDEILTKKIQNKETTKLENIIDLMVFKLYSLNFGECKLVNPEIEKLISCNDYECLDIEGLSKYEIK